MVAEGAGSAVVDAVTAAEFGDRLAARRLRPTVTFPVQVLAPPGRRMSLLAERFLALVRNEVAELTAPGSQWAAEGRASGRTLRRQAANLQRAGALAVARGPILDAHRTIRRNPLVPNVLFLLFRRLLMKAAVLNRCP